MVHVEKWQLFISLSIAAQYTLQCIYFIFLVQNRVLLIPTRLLLNRLFVSEDRFPWTVCQSTFIAEVSVRAISCLLCSAVVSCTATWKIWIPMAARCWLERVVVTSHCQHRRLAFVFRCTYAGKTRLTKPFTTNTSDPVCKDGCFLR